MANKDIGRFAHLGGLARAKSMTGAQRSEVSRRAAKTQQASLTAAERSERMRAVVNARWAAYRKKKRAKARLAKATRRAKRGGETAA